MVSNIFYFHPLFGEINPIWLIFFHTGWSHQPVLKWVGSTTNLEILPGNPFWWGDRIPDVKLFRHSLKTTVVQESVSKPLQVHYPGLSNHPQHALCQRPSKKRRESPPLWNWNDLIMDVDRLDHGPQNHEIWRFYTPNIWVITPKNEGFGFPWDRLFQGGISSLLKDYKHFLG